MREFWITAEQVFDGDVLHAQAGVRVLDGVVADVAPAASVPNDAQGLQHTGLLTPGFFDIQVNGGGGVLLNTSPTQEGITAIAAAHRRFGTVALMPTVITDAPEVLVRAVDATLAARDVPGVKGLHIEGPHLSRARRGTHDARYIRPMETATFDQVARLRDAGVAVLITVAPENASPADIARLTRMGAVVSLGHSDATAADVQAALDAGATCFTHLFNAMSPMLGRAPGVTGAAIASDAYCSIIADGHHVDPVMIGLAARARPQPDRMIAVSDAMATVGGPDAFDLYGQTIRLDNGKLINAEGALAGAHLTMADALRNLVSYGFDLQDALRMCRRNPAAALGLADDMAFIGLDAGDLALLDPDLRVTQVGIDVRAAQSKRV